MGRNKHRVKNNAPKWCYSKAKLNMKREVENALVEFCIEKNLKVNSRIVTDIRLKGLLP